MLQSGHAAVAGNVDGRNGGVPIRRGEVTQSWSRSVR